jgi:predicted acylesterase/phospholipase RssA
VILPSYHSDRHESTLLDTVTIWQAGRATSAVTMLFDSMKIGNEELGFVDGGLGANNLVRQMWTEAFDTCQPGESLEKRID